MTPNTKYDQHVARIRKELKSASRETKPTSSDVAVRVVSSVLAMLTVTLLFLPLSSWLLMLAFGIAHSVFPAISPIGFTDSIKLYVAVALTEIAMRRMKSRPS